MGAKPIQQQRPVTTQTLGNFLHGLQLQAHHVVAPLVQESPRPTCSLVFPEPLKVLAVQVGFHGRQVVLEQFPQLVSLRAAEIGRTLEQAPAGVLEDRFVAVVPHPLGFTGADLVDRLAHLLHDVKAVQHMYRGARLLGDHLEIRLPHVAADELQSAAKGGTQLLQSAPQRDFGPLAADPQQPL